MRGRLIRTTSKANGPSLLVYFQLGHAHLPSLLAGTVGFVAESAHIADFSGGEDVLVSPVRGACSAVNLGPGFAVGGDGDRVVGGIAFREENSHPGDSLCFAQVDLEGPGELPASPAPSIESIHPGSTASSRLDPTSSGASPA